MLEKGKKRKMNPLVSCVGIRESDLTADQVSKVNAFVAAQPPGDLLQVQLFPNFDATSEENNPSGMVAIFSGDAIADPTVLGDDLFQTTAVSKIIPQYNQKIDDEYFSGMKQEVLEAVTQFPAEPISGRVHNRHTNKEIKAWSPELGGDASFVGIYSKLRADHRSKDYFVVGRGTAPLYVSDVKKAIGSAVEKPTYLQLLNDDKWCDFVGAAQEASRRNVFRGMLNVAESCGVEIMRTDDVTNGASHVNADLAPPEMAVPEWVQPTNTIRNVTFQHKPAVAISYGVVPIENCYQLDQSHFFVVANPYDGISLFDMTRTEDMKRMIGLPADTGRSLAPETISTNASEYKDRLQGIVWEHSSESALVGAEHHVDLHPSAFRPVEGEFQQSMRGMGWNPEHHVQRLVCVLAKIYNPDMRRQ